MDIRRGRTGAMSLRHVGVQPLEGMAVCKRYGDDGTLVNALLGFYTELFYSHIRKFGNKLVIGK